MDSALTVERFPSELLLQSIVEENPEALTAVGLLMLGIGLANIYLDRSKKATADRLEETAVTNVASVTDGSVAVSGIARPAAETLDRPASDGECLAFERRTRTTRETRDRNQEEDGQDVSFETTTSSSIESTAFYLEDETGRVLIADDETPTLHLEQTDSMIEKPDPDELAEKKRKRSTTDGYTIITEQNHSYSELFPGDEIFVFGEVRPRALADGDALESESPIRITENDVTGDFIVTHFDKDWLLEKYTSNVQLLIGLVVSVLSVAFLAFIWLL